MKRTVQRPYAKKKAGGWVYLNEALIKSLKMGDVAEFGHLTVGTRELTKLLQLMPHPDSLIRANGKLEIEAVARVNRNDGEGHIKCHFQKPRRPTAFMSILDKAWLPKDPKTTVVIRPRKY